METSWNFNHILLHGRVESAPVPSHMSHGVAYFTFPLAVRRLSGVEDRINVVLSEQGLAVVDFLPQREVTVEGEVRSFNNRSGTGSRLVITVYGKKVSFETGEDENKLTLIGVLCKPPISRRTPLGREICDMMLAVNRRYGRTDYLPCIAWGSLAQRCGVMAVGGGLSVEGRLQSRAYTKQMGEESQTRVAFEISVMSMEEVQIEPPACASAK